MLFSRFAPSAALVLLTIGFAAPAHAQNNKQIISGTWYEDRALVSSGTGNNFTATFAQTPTNQFLNITNVNCAITLSSAQVLEGVFLEAGSASGINDLGRSMAIRGSVTPEISGSLKFYSIATNQLFFKFGPGRFPSIEIDTGTTGAVSDFANCVIVGNLTDN